MNHIIQDLKRTKFGFEGTLDYPLFETQIKVFVDREEDIEYAQKCADCLCNMSEDTLLRLSTYIIRYCEYHREYLEEDGSIPENISGTEILEYIVPSVLIVERPEDPSIIGFHVECGCDWEWEHGLEFTIRDEKILYVGPFDDMSPWNKGRLSYVGFYNPDNAESMNYADKED